jgi:hypothetical protein
MIEVVFAFLIGTVLGMAFLPFRDAMREHFTVVSIEIVGVAMAQVVEGGVFNFTVVAKNAAGRVVPDKGVTVSATGGSATVADDGSAGVFTAGAVDGDFAITATDGTLTSAPFAVSVVADNTPATLEVVAA